MQRECIPLPGPPEENELAVPSSTLRILNNSMCWLLDGAEGNAKANSNNSPLDSNYFRPPTYMDLGVGSGVRCKTILILMYILDISFLFSTLSSESEY